MQKKSQNIIQRFSLWLYKRVLPVYIPRGARFTAKTHLAIWCCGDGRNAHKLSYVLKATRITIRRNHYPVFVIKKGKL